MDVNTCKAQINEYNRKVKEYGNNVKELRKILDNLTHKLDDDIEKINREIRALAGDATHAVSHNAVYSANAEAIDDHMEPGIYGVSELNEASNAIQAEIQRISNLQGDAQNQVTRYKNEMDAEKQRIKDQKKKK